LDRLVCLHYEIDEKGEIHDGEHAHY
jgi:hypothetical protein